MIVRVFEDKKALGRAAGDHAAEILRGAIREGGLARIVVATGASQLDFLGALTELEEIDWSLVEMFHLDEYIGLPVAHPASFRKYLLENLIRKVDIKKYHLLDGEADPRTVISEIGTALKSAPIDVAFAGIGENGHLAFNDPPADFDATDPYLVVDLDEGCRRQQVGEGWFAEIAEVPLQAISMSVRQILGAREIICVVPDARKAEAVQRCLEGAISPAAPASILRTHPAVTVYLDQESASLLSPKTLAALAANR
jgi:glucosamine-6-phosphate deaminase